jgi:HK97 family phage major capsid protein
MELTDIGQAVDALGQAWEAHKTTMVDWEREVKRLGQATADTEAKLARIDAALDRLGAEKARLDRIETALRRPAGDGARPAGDDLTAEHKAAFLGYLRRGADERLPALEAKALSTGSDPDGGYLVPVEMARRIGERLRDQSPIRRLATATAISTEAMEGLREAGEAGAGWAAETGERPETAAPTLAKWRIATHEMYAEPRATQQMLDDAAIDVESWLADRIADRFARLEGEAFVTGDGVSRPRGLLTHPTAAQPDGARADGTLEHLSTGANADFAASGGADVLFETVAALGAGYLGRAVWLARRSVLARIRRLKSNDAYLWQPGLQQAEPATLLGHPVHGCEDLPALAAGSTSLVFGDLAAAYQIVDRPGLRTLRDPFTTKPFVKFYSTRRVGGAVVDFDAVKLVRFAA